MSKNTRKRTIIYSNIKEKKRLAEEKNKKDEQINLDDEVIIGFNNKKNQAKGKNTTTKKILKPQKNKINGNKKIAKKTKKKSKQNNKRENEVKSTQGKKMKVPLYLKITILVCGFFVAIYMFLRSPIFNIREINIKIENNDNITISEIKEISQLSEGQNMFSISKGRIIQELKSNAYVERVSVKRKIPSKIQIEVVERQIAFQIQTENGYYYIDKQGYILDNKNEKKECIILCGLSTEDLIVGNRLNDEDIAGLHDAIEIIEESKNNDISAEITKVDISNHYDYLVYFENIGKVVHMGDISLLNDKLARVAKIIKIETDVEGEIFVNVDFNNGKYPFFREKV